MSGQSKWTNFGKSAAGLAIVIGGALMLVVMPDQRDEAIQFIYTGAGLMGFGIVHKIVREE